MILDNRKRLVELESEDGTYRLVGAAFASPKLAPWVIDTQRAQFKDKVNEIAKLDEVTHTGAKISADSAGVFTGIEAQRDRIPVANEIVAARDYQLPSSISADRLSLPKAHPERWASELTRYLTASMRAHKGRLHVTLQAAGRDGVHVFGVTNGGEHVGTLRVYDSMAIAEVDAQFRAELADAVPSLETGALRGQAAVHGGTMAELVSHKSDPATGRPVTFDSLVDAWATAEGAGKDAAFKKIEAAVISSGRTLAELHNHFASGELMSASAKQEQIAKLHVELASPQVVNALGADRIVRLRAALAPMEAAFMAEAVPATAELGLDAGAFAFRDLQPSSTDKDVMEYRKLSVEDFARPNQNGSGAADVAVFLEALHREPRLGEKRSKLEDQFTDQYGRSRKATRSPTSATAWYRVATEIRYANQNPQQALTRIDALVGGGT